ncbi:MAG: hypothetical protein ACP5RD_05560 [bacterium]
MLRGKHSIVSFVNIKNLLNNFFNENDLKIVYQSFNNFDLLSRKFIKKQFLSKDLRANFYKEIFALQKLSKYSFIPKLIYYNLDELYVIMEYIEGISLKEFFKKINSVNKDKNSVNKDKKKVLIRIYKILMKICILLDIEGVFKDEWLRPFKHVILNLKNDQVLGIYIIDFDRSNFNKELKNFPQFINFVFNNLGFREYFYLAKDISCYYFKVFSKYLDFKDEILELKNFK